MMGRTHLIGDVASLWLLRAAPGFLAPSSDGTPGSVGLLALAAAFGAVLPDLDASDSYLKRLSIKGIAPLYVPATLLHQMLGHRTLTHSFLGLGIAMVIVALPLGLWLGASVGIAVACGYLSHLLLDACTPSGIPLLFPKPTRYHALPKRLWITTGSTEEGVAFVLLSVLTLLLLLPLVASSGASL